MEHKPFHIYTAKIGIPDDKTDTKSKIVAKFHRKFPGMKIEFSNQSELGLVSLSPGDLISQVDDALAEFRYADSN